MEADDDNDEVLVRDIVRDEKLRVVLQHSRLNAMQSILAQQLLSSNDSMVVSSPTGSGKTVLHELAILRLLLADDKARPKVIFIAPTKALCQQRCSGWQSTFGAMLGLRVVEATGDTNPKDMLQLIAAAQIIITTPEKLDSLTRSWQSNLFLLGAVQLLLLDEVHHLSDHPRGATLEAVVMRMKLIGAKCRERKNNKEEELRIIALSATLPNLEDIGQWLGCSPSSIHTFDDTFRPVPLEVVVEKCAGGGSNAFLFEKSLDGLVNNVITAHSAGKPVLIFCSAKKGAEDLAQSLCSSMGRRGKAVVSGSAAATRLNNIIDPKLQALARSGFAYHHAGLGADDRAAVEALYLAGHIHILATTSTLAYGVNLPAYLVIIKGTNCWRGTLKGYERLSKTDVMQMIGRAGRSGFDQSGKAVIMTSAVDAPFYSSIATHGADVVESSLLDQMHEALAAEISQNVIASLDDAVSWLKGSFFYIRVTKNPRHYNFDPSTVQAELKNLLDMTIQELAKKKMIALHHREEGSAIEALAECRIMTQACIRFNSMALIMDMANSADLDLLLHSLSMSEELHKPLRRSEKKVLNDIAKNMRFPYKSKQTTKESSHKAYVLMQAAVSRVPLGSGDGDWALRVEQSEIVEQALRILAALVEYAKESNKGALLEAAIVVERALKLRCWGDGTDSPLLQQPVFSKLTGAVVKKIQDRGLGFRDLDGLQLHEIRELIVCNDAEAQELHNLCVGAKAASFNIKLSKGGGDTLNVDLLGGAGVGAGRSINPTVSSSATTCSPPRSSCTAPSPSPAPKPSPLLSMAPVLKTCAAASC